MGDMLINIRVKISKKDAKQIREGELDKWSAIDSSVSQGHYSIIETIDKGE